MILLKRAIYCLQQMGKNPHIRGSNREAKQAMWRLIKFIFVLAILAALALVAYAYVGPLFFPADFAAPSQEVTRPVTLDPN